MISKNKVLILLGLVSASSKANDLIKGNDLPSSANLKTNTTSQFITREELINLGIETRVFKNRDGKIRSLLKNEPVKVIYHEEAKVISFTSFDYYSLTLDIEKSDTPKNVGGGE